MAPSPHHQMLSRHDVKGYGRERERRDKELRQTQLKGRRAGREAETTRARRSGSRERSAASLPRGARFTVRQTEQRRMRVIVRCVVVAASIQCLYACCVLRAVSAAARARPTL